jgi:hypothetical protein
MIKVMTLAIILFQIDYTQLAEEVAKLQPDNDTEITLWGFAMLLALASGYGLAYILYKNGQKYQERVEKTLTNLDKTMTLVIPHLASNIEDKKEDKKVIQDIKEELIKTNERLNHIVNQNDKP